MSRVMKGDYFKMKGSDRIYRCEGYDPYVSDVMIAWNSEDRCYVTFRNEEIDFAKLESDPRKDLKKFVYNSLLRSDYSNGFNDAVKELLYIARGKTPEELLEYVCKELEALTPKDDIYSFGRQAVFEEMSVALNIALAKEDYDETSSSDLP